MTRDEETAGLDAWIDALAPVVRIAVADDDRAGVRLNLAVAMRMAALLDEIDLGDEAEPAPVFTP